MHVQEATELLKDGIDLIPDADTALSNLLSYPLHSTLSRYYITSLFH
jgi:glutamyl-tRNA synthetase